MFGSRGVRNLEVTVELPLLLYLPTVSIYNYYSYRSEFNTVWWLNKPWTRHCLRLVFENIIIYNITAKSCVHLRNIMDRIATLWLRQFLSTLYKLRDSVIRQTPYIQTISILWREPLVFRLQTSSSELLVQADSIAVFEIVPYHGYSALYRVLAIL